MPYAIRKITVRTLKLLFWGILLQGENNIRDLFHYYELVSAMFFNCNKFARCRRIFSCTE